MIQSWENLVTDGQIERQTDQQTDQQEWFHRHCPTNVECPKKKQKKKQKK